MPKTTALAALLDEFHRFGTPSHPDQQICCCSERDIELARAELDEIQAEADLPCYLCAEGEVMGFKSRKHGPGDPLRMSCGLACDHKMEVVKLKDLVSKAGPETKLRIRLSLNQGTMGAPYASLELEEA